MKRDQWTAFVSVGVSLLLGLTVILLFAPDSKKSPVKKPLEKVQMTKPEMQKTPKPQSIQLPPPPEQKVAKAAPETASKPVAKPKPKPVAKPAAKPLPVKKPVPKPVEAPKVEKATVEKAPAKQEETLQVAMAGKQLVQEGRALLRILEHGSGPVIEIAWPAGRGAREQLYQNLASCYGMRVALMAPDMRLFVADDARGQAWDFNADRYSGFVRQPSGALAPNEEREQNTIRRHHGLSYQSQAVRIFPRQLDALLLGGMGRLIGAGYSKAKSIHATYALKGGRLLVERITVDGRKVPGTVDFTGSHGRCRV